MFGSIRVVAYAHKVRKTVKRDYGFSIYSGAPPGSDALATYDKLCFIGWSSNMPAQETAARYVLACNSLGRQPRNDKECAEALGNEGCTELSAALESFEW